MARNKVLESQQRFKENKAALEKSAVDKLREPALK